MKPKIISKSHSPHVQKTISAKQKQEDLVKSTSVVLAKYPLKVKLENFPNSRVPELRKLCVPWFVRALGFL